MCCSKSDSCLRPIKDQAVWWEICERPDFPVRKDADTSTEAVPYCVSTSRCFLNGTTDKERMARQWSLFYSIENTKLRFSICVLISRALVK